jgi:hypothetical protein
MNGFISALLLLSMSLGPQAYATGAKEKRPPVPAINEKNNDDPKDESEDKNSDSEVANILNSLGYPELQVVPRASERLRIEAKEERGSWFVMHWPTELSGLVTMTNGLMADGYKKDDLSASGSDQFNTIKTFTTVVGAGWLVGGLVIGGRKPYGRGLASLGKGSPRDERSALLRERLAEEALERPAKVMRILKHFSVISNFSMNVLTGIYLNNDGKVIAGLSAVLSFLPYMFEDHSIAVHNKHIEYKKKIYTPIKGASVHFDPESKKITPMTTLAWTF